MSLETFFSLLNFCLLICICALYIIVKKWGEVIKGPFVVSLNTFLFCSGCS